MSALFTVLFLFSQSFAADLGVKGGWARPQGHYSRYAYGFEGDLDFIKDWKLGIYYLTSSRSSEAESRLNHYGFQVETRLAPLAGQQFDHFHVGVRLGAADIFRAPSALGPGHYDTDLALGLQIRAAWFVFKDYDVGGEAAYIFDIGPRSSPVLYILGNLRYVF